MRPTSRFHEQCRRIQFVLDKPVEQPDRRRERVADLVGRVRSHGLRISHAVTPELHGVVTRVTESLLLPANPEVYVVNDPHANAYAPALAGTAPFVVVNSGLVDLLSPLEMEFALGHELGHLGLQHGWGEEDEPDPTEFEALQRRSRMRCAEISADRVGLLANRSLVVAARVMLKIASGLRDDRLVVDVSTFLSQLERDPDECNREWELHESHPSLPMRLLALMKFSRTAEYATMSGTGHSGVPLETVDTEIAEWMSQLGDGRLDRMEQDFIHLALTWVGLSLIMEDSVIEKGEEIALSDLVGHEQARKAIVFAKDQGHEAIQDKLKEAAGRVRTSHVRVLHQFRRSIDAFALELEVENWHETDTGRTLLGLLNLATSER